MEQVQYIPIHKSIVEAVDLIMKVAKRNGSKDTVDKESDWQTVTFLYKTWSILYPQEYKTFIKSISAFRKSEEKHGIGGDHGAKIQHQLEVPEKFHALMMTIFPKQKWDKAFVSQLTKKLPQLNPSGDKE